MSVKSPLVAGAAEGKASSAIGCKPNTSSLSAYMCTDTGKAISLLIVYFIYLIDSESHLIKQFVKIFRIISDCIARL